LPGWIPPKWQSQLQPDAQWRKELLDRRRRLLEQAGEQLTVLGLKLNEVTGYKEVERLKDLVGEKGE
jgi:sensitive to high expression protein 9